LLRSVGFDKDKRELLANITFVNPGTNKRLRYEPYVYIKKYEIDEEDLKKQLVPIDENLWKVSNYTLFLEKRAELIADSINDYIIKLYPKLFEQLVV